MNPTAILLVVASAALHATWNFLLKRHEGGTAFVGLSKVSEVVVFLPVFLWWSLPDVSTHLGAWPLVVIGAALTLSNYLALAKAYSIGDLSVVYPVARGGILLFLPLLGSLVFAERLSPTGWIALACIVAGILVIRLPALDGTSVLALGRMLRDPSIVFALLAALATASYTVWDKRAIQHIPAFAYFYSYTMIVALAFTGFLLRRFSLTTLREELRRKGIAIVAVGVLNTVSYLLVLFALRTGTSSYVLALRQLSIAIGVLLGWRLLGEGFAVPKRVGVSLIVGGCLLVALAGR